MTNNVRSRRMFHRIHPERAPIVQRVLMERAQQLATAGDLDGMDEALRDIERVGEDVARASAYIEEFGSETTEDPDAEGMVVGRA